MVCQRYTKLTTLYVQWYQVSMVKAPTELLSKCIAFILCNIRNEDLNIRSFGDLQRLLTGVDIQDDDIMVSSLPSILNPTT